MPSPPVTDYCHVARGAVTNVATVQTIRIVPVEHERDRISGYLRPVLEIFFQRDLCLVDIFNLHVLLKALPSAPLRPR